MRYRWDCILDRMPDGLVVGAEIGVGNGTNAHEMLQRRPDDLVLYLVDINPLPKLPNTVPFHMTSLEAAKFIAHPMFDFVFIDADHTYQAVKDDILAWRPKVKPGGWLCGHDFANPKDQVQQAVEELCEGFELDSDDTWFVRKLTRT